MDYSMRLMFYADCNFKCGDFHRVVPLIAVMGKRVIVSAAFFELHPGAARTYSTWRLMGANACVACLHGLLACVGGLNPQPPGKYHVIPILCVTDITKPAEAWLLHKVMRHMLRQQLEAATAAKDAYLLAGATERARTAVKRYAAVTCGTSKRTRTGTSKASDTGEQTAGGVYKAALQAAGLTTILEPTFALPDVDWEPDVRVEYTRRYPLHAT